MNRISVRINAGPAGPIILVSAIAPLPELILRWVVAGERRTNEEVAVTGCGRRRVGELTPRVKAGLNARSSRALVIRRFQELIGIEAAIAQILEGDDMHAERMREFYKIAKIVDAS